MKKQIVIFFAAALAATSVWADEWTDPDTGCTWIYRINGAATVKGARGVAVKIK